MSANLPEFNLVKPSSIAEALAAFRDQPHAKFCAGGTDLIPNMRHGLFEVETLIDLGQIVGFDAVTINGADIELGAGISLSKLVGRADIRERFPAIVKACEKVAGLSHREAATLGGNLCLETRCLYYNQSEWWRKSNDYCLKYQGDICHVAPRGNRCRAAFCGDLAPAFMVHRAEVELVSLNGARRLPLADLYVEDGAAHLALQPGEILASVHLPAARARSTYGKICQRGAIDFPQAGVAVSCRKEAGVLQFELAFTGTNSKPILLEYREPLGPKTDADSYFEALEKQVQKSVSPQRTTTTAPHYRRLAVAALAVRLARGLV
ncbi:MAG: 4-hydroxybenzoyl-CoA reductase subunit beta [Alphaproteobacteria bacterium]|nr:4-hydroxybenzoyl-CoA reductase subunit beta [Alphaproteobacteria bacterium]